MKRQRDRPSTACLLAAALALATLAPEAEAADGETLEVKRFSLHKNARETAVFQVDRTGELTLRVVLKKGVRTAPVHLLLEGPDGLQVEKQGMTPMRLRYTLRDEERLGAWRAVVHNNGNIPVFVGELRIDFRESTESPERSPGRSPGGAPHPIADDTDGRVLTADDQTRIRAACHGKNEDVQVRLDMKAGTGALLMSYNPVFRLTASYRSDTVVEMGGTQTNSSMLLDLKKRVLYFATGETGIFCKVRIFYGE